MPKRYVVSACLAGEACRYDGGSSPCAAVMELMKEGRALAVCPERLGGLPTPRTPAEIRKGRVIMRDGTDVTEAFTRGAQEALRRAAAEGCEAAVLKARSPSCGAGVVYDGTFGGVRVPGDGVFARMVREAGFSIETEETFGGGDSAPLPAASRRGA